MNIVKHWLKEEDFEITAGCDAVHPDRRGGQHVAKQCVGVRVRHIPSGKEVLCTEERSQYKNRIRAMEEILKII